MAGMLMSADFVAAGIPEGWTFLVDPRYLVYGLPFSATLLIILGVHEMGHYVTSRHWGVKATLPYFIPFPSMIGTLGAVIKLRSRIPNRRALIDIGASGPIAGFVMAVIALAVGLAMSEVIETRDVPEGSLSLGDSLLSSWIGECFVFDNRVSVKNELKNGTYSLCHGCRYPVSIKETKSNKFEEGVTCPKCFNELTLEKKIKLRERNKQIKISKKRGLYNPYIKITPSDF